MALLLGIIPRDLQSIMTVSATSNNTKLQQKRPRPTLQPLPSLEASPQKDHSDLIAIVMGIIGGQALGGVALAGIGWYAASLISHRRQIHLNKPKAEALVKEFLGSNTAKVFKKALPTFIPPSVQLSKQGHYFQRNKINIDPRYRLTSDLGHEMTHGFLAQYVKAKHEERVKGKLLAPLLRFIGKPRPTSSLQEERLAELMGNIHFSEGHKLDRDFPLAASKLWMKGVEADYVKEGLKPEFPARIRADMHGLISKWVKEGVLTEEEAKWVIEGKH
ncbi:MAG: hypothetical protein ACKO37_03175 [Vampirovibrionales bacterium]